MLGRSKQSFAALDEIRQSIRGVLYATQKVQRDEPYAGQHEFYEQNNRIWPPKFKIEPEIKRMKKNVCLSLTATRTFSGRSHKLEVEVALLQR
jgi:hypothetical protein